VKNEKIAVLLEELDCLPHKRTVENFNIMQYNAINEEEVFQDRKRVA
jgi:hypothetical protein